ncbi:MAG: SDR family oxidoreductase [Thermodesulfobacteriota bacterium]
MKNLAKKVVAITGAAAGIGKEMALLFAAEKASLALMDINEKQLEVTAGELAGYGVTVRKYVCNVADKDKVEAVCAEIKRDFGFVDVLVNNAGIVVGKSIEDSSYEEIRRTIDVNLTGLIWLTKQFLPEMTRRNSGHIVNIASAAGMLAIPLLGDYCATKFAVVGFTDALRMEMKKFGHAGVKTTCVCPSIIDTGMFTGFKPPLLNPLLQPKEVARRVVDAVKMEKTYVKMPFMVNLIPLFKFLPAPFVDWLGDILGTTRSMDHFKGH